MSIKALKSKRLNQINSRQEILDKAMNEKRGLTDLEKETVKNYSQEIRNLSGSISTEETNDLSEKQFLPLAKAEDIKIENKVLASEFSNYMSTGKVGEELRAVGADKLNPTAGNAVIIPTELSKFIVDKMGEYSDVFAESTKFASVTGKFQITMDDDEFDQASLVTEGTDFSDWKKLDYKAKVLDQLRFVSGYILTQQLINNSAYNLVPYCLEKLSKKMVRKAEEQIWNGTGNANSGQTGRTQFEGLITANSGVIEQTIADDGAAVVIDAFMDLYNGLHPNFLGSAKWYMTRKLYNAVCLMKDSVGHYYVQNGIVNGKLTRTLFGAPIVITQELSKSNPVYFGSISSAYGIMIKKGMELRHIYKDTQNAVQGTHTLLMDMFMDGCVLNPQAIVRLKVTTPSVLETPNPEALETPEEFTEEKPKRGRAKAINTSQE